VLWVSGWDCRLCIWEVDTAIVGKQQGAVARRVGTTGGGDGSSGGGAIVVAAAGEGDRSVGRVVPLIDEVSLHTKPLSALGASADHLFTGAPCGSSPPSPLPT
jgi:hypothetical protein